MQSGQGSYWCDVVDGGGDDDDDDDDDDQEKDGEEAGAAVQMALGEIQELGGHGQGPETAEAIEVVNHSFQLQCSTINMMSITHYTSKCGNDEYHEVYDF